MPDLRRAVAALGPVAAGAVVAARERRAVGLRTGEDVVLVGGVAAPVDQLSLLGQRGLLGQVVGAVQLRRIARDDDAFRVLPGASGGLILA